MGGSFMLSVPFLFWNYVRPSFLTPNCQDEENYASRKWGKPYKQNPYAAEGSRNTLNLPVLSAHFRDIATPYSNHKNLRLLYTMGSGTTAFWEAHWSNFD